MGFFDVFRPNYRHSDVRRRSEAVRALTAEDTPVLISIAKNDQEASVRRLAIEKIAVADVLAEIARADGDRAVRDLAQERAAQLWIDAACRGDGEAATTALGGILKLGDQHALVDVITRTESAAVKKRALAELSDPKALAELAKRDTAQELRLHAVSKIDDAEVLRALATDTTSKEVGLAAIDRLEDPAVLEHVATKAKNKAVRTRARKIVGEMAAAASAATAAVEAAKKPAVPDEVKRRRAEKAQLLRQLEAVGESVEHEKIAEALRVTEAAWAALGEHADPGDEKFDRAGKLLRAKLERLGAAKVAAKAAARKPAAEAPAAEAPASRDAGPDARDPRDASAAPAAPDEAELARRAAEAEARRAANAEAEGRRAAAAAEREARAQEEAALAAAYGVKMTAAVAEMEALLAAEAVDGKAIDKLLNHAARGFEQVGRLAAPERAALTERYRAARAALVVKVSELRDAEDWLRWSMVPRAEALIALAKEVLEAEATPELPAQLKELQATWKALGPMPQKRSKELWESFKATCDLIYDKVRGVRAVEQEQYDAVTKVKVALIAEAEALAESTDWQATAAQLKELQAKWKDSGHLPRKLGDELWQRFRGACDKFFARRAPLLEQARAEEQRNLAAKRALVERAQRIADKAPGEGGWGKAIGEIKDLQQAWKEIGFVPRRDVEAVYQAFRAACDALFIKRGEARDAEANAARDELDGLRQEIEGLRAGGDELVARTIAARGKLRELAAPSAELAGMMEAVVRQVLASHADQVKGTELDPGRLRAQREELIARATALLPKGRDEAPAAVDVAAQLKAAMAKNAFGSLRFSGRDPVEVVDELRAAWREVGPELEDADGALGVRFAEVCAGVLAAAGAREAASRDEGAEARPARDGREPRERRERRERPERKPEAAPAAIAAPVAEATVATPVVEAVSAAVTAPVSAGAAVAAAVLEASAKPVDLTPRPPVVPSEVAALAATASEAPRARSLSQAPVLDEIDTGWDEEPKG